MFRQNAPDILAVVGLGVLGYGINEINTHVALIVVGGILFVLGLIGSLK